MIYPLISIQFIFFSLVFVIGSLVTFYVPGSLLFKDLKKSFALYVLLSFIFGITVFGFLSYIFGYTHLRFLQYFYVLLLVGIAIVKRNEYLKDLRELPHLIYENILLVIFSVGAIISQVIPVFFSGVKYNEGVRFFGVNGMDGIMHLAFIRGIVHHFPPQEPGAFGNPLTNYHYWSDMILADFIRVWHLPTTHVFFQFFPILIAILTATAAYQLMKVLGFTKAAGWWLIFFLFFAGDLAYLLMFIARHVLSFSAPVIDNGIDQFLNMPNALARLIFVTGIISLWFLLKEKTRKWQIVTLLFFSVLIGVKVYYGIFVMIGLGSIAVWNIAKRLLTGKKANRSIPVLFKDERHIFLPLIIASLISLIIYLPANKGAGGLVFAPLEWPKLFLGPDGLNWSEWFFRQEIYAQHHNLKNIIFYDVIAIGIAMLCIYGTRLLGIAGLKKLYEKTGTQLIVFLIPGLLLFNFLGLFTLQKAGGFNVFNFFVVCAVVLSILSAILLEKIIFTKKLLPVIVALCLILLTIPRSINQLNDKIQQVRHPVERSVLISNGELDGFSFIRTHSQVDDVVQAYPTDPLDFDTPYVSFFSDRLTYLSGVGLQRTHNQPIEPRRVKLRELFEAISSPDFHGKAKNLGITYIYLKKTTPGQTLAFNLDENLIKKVFENKTVIIYRINNKK